MWTSRKYLDRRGPNAACASAGADEAQEGLDQKSSTSNRGYFSLTLIAALGLALAATVIIAPFAALATAAAGFDFPFPRIFDRVITIALFSAMLLFAHRLKLLDLLREGFSNWRAGIRQGLGGLALAAAAMSVLFGLAAAAGGNLRIAMIAAAVGRYLPAAIVIAVIEEGFFRAFLLAGIQRERGSAAALLASSVIFALVHVIRSPARFYLTQFEPMAGVKVLAAYAARLSRPEVGPSLLGLFLLGLVLGEAFILTRRVYCSLGLHVGLVLGAKAWGRAVGGIIPRWLAGPGSVPVIAAPAAWVISALMLLILWRWLGRETQPLLNGLSSPPVPVEGRGSQPRMAGSAGVAASDLAHGRADQSPVKSTKRA
jgi:membrane protease YdiL (CAAX protease family)